MTNYKVNTRDTREAILDAEIEQLEKEQKERSGAPPVEDVNVPQTPQPEQDDSWKKRYSDLRSHTSKKENEWKLREKQLQEQLAAAASKEMRLPKTQDEVKEWLEAYPDVGGIVETIASMKAGEAAKQIKDELEVLKVERRQTAKERAFNEVLKVHPDFGDLIHQQDFKDWVENQPIERGERIGQAIYDALYENETDALAAINAVNIYKNDKNLSAKPKRQKEANNEAALEVGRSRQRPPSNDGDKPTFLESQIESLSIRDYERLEAQIDEARREGRIVYDLTAGAS